MYEPRLEAEALSKAGGLPTVRLDHAARFGQPLLVLVSVHEIQQVGFAGELNQIRMGGDQRLAPVDDLGRLCSTLGSTAPAYRPIVRCRNSSACVRWPPEKKASPPCAAPWTTSRETSSPNCWYAPSSS